MDFNARYYDPAIGRFTSVDPLADHPDQVDKSPYAFSWNNPVKLSDPSGEFPFVIPLIIAAAEAIVAAVTIEAVVATAVVATTVVVAKETIDNIPTEIYTIPSVVTTPPIEITDFPFLEDVVMPDVVFSKGGNRNIWPDQYDKPNADDVDWSKGDQQLANEITGAVAKGAATANNLVKKWFSKKRPKNNKK